MAQFKVFEIRPVDDGAWVRVIVDLPARHDKNLSESFDINLYVSGVLEQSISEIIRKAEGEARVMLAAALGV